MPGKPQTDGETLPQRRRVGISMQRLLSIAHACAYASSGGSTGLILDGKTDVFAAYSFFRKLRTAYTGAAFRVIRSNDSAQQDIGFAGIAVDAAALAAFVGANSAKIVTVYDQSTTGHDLTQGTDASRPRIRNSGTSDTINGHLAAYFNDGPALSKSSVAFTGTAWSFAAVAKRNSAGSNYDAMWGWKEGGDTGAVFYIMGSAAAGWQNGDPVLAGDGYGANPRIIGTGPVDNADASPVVWGGTISNSVQTLYRNGSAVAVRSAGGGAIDASGTGVLALGSGSAAGAGNPWIGHIGELILFSANKESSLPAIFTDQATVWQ